MEAVVNLIGKMEDNPLYILLLAGAALAFLIGFFFFTILRHHRRYLHLQQERTRNEIVILEKERKRIACDLHDELGPVLASIKMNLLSLEVPDAAEQEIIEKSCAKIDDIVHNMRSISYDLLPVTLQRQGLKAAVEELLGRNEVKKKLMTSIEMDDDIVFDKEKEIHLFRIIQEVLHNTIKHSKADRFRIALKRQGRRQFLILEDDGRGFDMGKARDSSGLGLKSIESRAQVLDAKLTIHSEPGKGVFYCLEMPGVRIP